jgi:CHASE2 domain-containing sensor protein
MGFKLKQFIKQYIKQYIKLYCVCLFPTARHRLHPVFGITPTVAATVIAGNILGVFNLLEWEVRDEFFRLRPAASQEDAIVIVTIDEADIQAAGNWPISDRTLADLLTAIRAQKPRVIGLDLYRDIPEEPGHQFRG